MDFEPSAAADHTERMRGFLDDEILPAEPEYAAFRAERRGSSREWELPPVVEELKRKARERGLWNLFMPSVSGLSNLEYAPVAEVSGCGGVSAQHDQVGRFLGERGVRSDRLRARRPPSARRRAEPVAPR